MDYVIRPLTSADEPVLWEMLYQALHTGAAEPRNGWKPGMIPVLNDDQDNFVCLDTTRPGVPLVECWRGRDAAIDVAPSLTAWLTGFVSAVEHGDYFEDDERGTFRKKS